MKRIICIGVVVMLIVMMFSGCSSLKYNEFFIVGKSMEEVIAWCGEPDYSGIRHDDNGNEIGYFMRYITQEGRNDFPFETEEEHTTIRFDLNGIATEVVQFQPAP